MKTKKVKAIFNSEMYSLHYLNNRLVDIFPDDENEEFDYSFGLLEDVERYCSDNNLELVSIVGLDN